MTTLCFLTGTLDALAGAERVTAVVANGLAARGYRIHILSLWSAATQYPLHPAIRHDALFAARPSFKTAYAASVRSIRSYVKTHGIDVLIGVDTMLALFTLPACVGLPVRQLAWEHANFDEDLGRPARRTARRLAARWFDAVVVLTRRDRERWSDALRPRRPVVVIPNPLPFPMPEVAMEHKQPLVLAVGRLEAVKGFDILLDAWQRVHAEAPDWRLRIVGEGSQREALEAQRQALDLAHCVELPGATADVTPHYGEAGVFCLSSRHEGFGMVLIEAMAYGLPIVSTACETGPREILEADRTALMVEVGNAALLAEALLRMIGNAALRTRLGAAGRHDAADYALDRVLDDWETLLNARGNGAPSA
jgi:glycosyltransferase involved in cell wall biosynthesis